MSLYKPESYRLQKTVKAAKKCFRRKVEQQLNNRDSRSMWQGLRTMTGYRG